MGKTTQYLKNVAIGLDQLLNACTGGDPDETLSSRAGRYSRYTWGRILCTALGWLDPRHCQQSLEPDDRHSQEL